MKRYYIEESPFSHFLTADTRSSILWLVLRVYLGWIWLEAGWNKFNNPAWIGDSAGAAMQGFVQNALTKTIGAHPDVQGWYASFLENVVLPNAELWSYLIVYGEILVGIGLIVGCFTGLAALFGVLMNLNFMLAGSVGINPIMALIAIGIILAWRVAGYWGLDRYVLPLLHKRVRPRTVPT